MSNWQAIRKALSAYCIAFVAAVAVASAFGSFVLLEWWTPLQSEFGRFAAAWIPVAAAVPAYISARLSDA